MKRIFIDELDFSVDRFLFYFGILQLVRGVATVSRFVFQDQSAGWVRANGSSFGKRIWLDSKQNRAFMDSIDDIHIKQMCDKLLKAVEGYSAHDLFMALSIAHHYGIKDLREGRSKQRLNRMIRKDEEAMYLERKDQFSWVRESWYQDLLSKSMEHYDAIMDLVRKIEEMIIEMFPEIKNT